MPSAVPLSARCRSALTCRSCSRSRRVSISRWLASRAGAGWSAGFARCVPLGLKRRAFHAVPVAFPPVLVTSRHVVVAVPQPGGPVDELADDVGLAGMPVGFGNDVDEALVQRPLPPLTRPPRHVPKCVQAQRADGGARGPPGPPVQPGDL